MYGATCSFGMHYLQELVRILNKIKFRGKFRNVFYRVNSVTVDLSYRVAGCNLGRVGKY